MKTRVGIQHGASVLRACVHAILRRSQLATLSSPALDSVCELWANAAGGDVVCLVAGAPARRLRGLLRAARAIGGWARAGARGLGGVASHGADPSDRRGQAPGYQQCA